MIVKTKDHDLPRILKFCWAPLNQALLVMLLVAFLVNFSSPLVVCKIKVDDKPVGRFTGACPPDC
jgi:hypothetical protein